MQQLPTVKPKIRREASAGKRLPYARLLDERTVETRDGLLMQVIHLAGLPFETADSETLNYRKATAVWNIHPDLANAGATVLDEPCVVDRNLITARFPYDLPRMIEALVKQLVR